MRAEGSLLGARGARGVRRDPAAARHLVRRGVGGVHRRGADPRLARCVQRAWTIEPELPLSGRRQSWPGARCWMHGLRQDRPSTNPASGERITFRETAATTGGELVAIDLELPAGRRCRPLHIHPRQEERFEVVAGTMRFRMGRERVVAGPGDVVARAGRRQARLRERRRPDALVRVEVRPALQMERLFETAVALAEQGRTLRSGIPTPLELALFTREFEDEVQAAFPPRWVQRAALAPLRWLARLRRGACRRLSRLSLDRDVPEREPALELRLDGQLGADLGLQAQLALGVALLLAAGRDERVERARACSCRSSRPACPGRRGTRTPRTAGGRRSRRACSSVETALIADDEVLEVGVGEDHPAVAELVVLALDRASRSRRRCSSRAPPSRRRSPRSRPCRAAGRRSPPCPRS